MRQVSAERVRTQQRRGNADPLAVHQFWQNSPPMRRYNVFCRRRYPVKRLKHTIKEEQPAARTASGKGGAYSSVNARDRPEVLQLKIRAL